MTGTDQYYEKLESFKQNESPEVILLIADDPDLTRIIVAWMSMAVSKSNRCTELRGDSAHEVWAWLWENTVYSRKELTAKSGLIDHRFERRLDTLIGNRILYPDGTVNSFVQRYLREKVLTLFAAKPKKFAKK